jgi:hypothetical protein
MDVSVIKSRMRAHLIAKGESEPFAEAEAAPYALRFRALREDSFDSFT